MFKVTRLSAAILGAGALMLVSAAGAQTSDKPLDKVSMRYGFVATGIDAVWTYGRDLGVFRDAGIDLELREGKGSAVTAQTVAAGTDDFGADIDGGTFLSLAAKGLPATAVLASAGNSPLTVLSPLSKPLKTPADLIGKQLAITAGDGPSALLPVVFARNGVDGSQVTLINMQPGPKLTSLLTGRVDGVVTNVAVKVQLEMKGLPVNALMYSDFKVVTPGQYVVTSNATLRDKPDLVKRFVGALQKAMAATEKDPQAAADSFVKTYPSYDPATALGETKLFLSLMRSKSTLAAPIGTVSLDDAKAGADVLAASGLITGSPDASAFVTNRFVAP